MTHHMKAKKNDRIVAKFNVDNPIGTQVRYWRGAKVGNPCGVGRTVTPASILGGHTPVVWIDGNSGAMALTHVEVVPCTACRGTGQIGGTDSSPFPCLACMRMEVDA